MNHSENESVNDDSLKLVDEKNESLPASESGEIYGLAEEPPPFVPPSRPAVNVTPVAAEGSAKSAKKRGANSSNSAYNENESEFSLEAIYERRREERKKQFEEEILTHQYLRELPKHPFRDGFYRPLVAPRVIMRIFVMTCTAFIPFFFALKLFNSLLSRKYLEEGNKLVHFFSCLWDDKVILFLFCVLWGAFSIPYILHIFGATAEGDDRMDEWPEYSFIGGLGQFLWLAVLALLGGLPGYLIGIIIGQPLIIFLISTLLLTPPFFLSCMEADSPFCLMTKTVAASYKNLGRFWIVFYFYSLGLFLFAAGVNIVLLLMLQGKETPLVTCILVALLISLLMSVIPVIYLRLLGRLAWIIADDSRRREPSAEEEELQ